MCSWTFWFSSKELFSRKPLWNQNVRIFDSKRAQIPDEPKSRLRAAESSGNATAVGNASVDIAAIDPQYQAAGSNEDKVRGRYLDAMRRFQALQRTLVNRANGAMNFNRMFGIKYRDILATAPAIRSQYTAFQRRLVALDYDDFSVSPTGNANASERIKAKSRQLALSMRIPISIEDILETAKKNAAVDAK